MWIFLHLCYLEFIEPHQVCELSAVIFLNTLMLLYSSALFLVLTLHICYIDVLNGVHVCLRRFIYFSILLISGFQTVSTLSLLKFDEFFFFSSVRSNLVLNPSSEFFISTKVLSDPEFPCFSCLYFVFVLVFFIYSLFFGIILYLVIHCFLIFYHFSKLGSFSSMNTFVTAA